MARPRPKSLHGAGDLAEISIHHLFQIRDLSPAVILDAKNLSNGPIARISIPQRVPYGFHGIWVEGEDSVTQLG